MSEEPAPCMPSAVDRGPAISLTSRYSKVAPWLRPMTCSEKRGGVRRREGRLPQDRMHRSPSELAMQRNDDRSPVRPELYVAASLPHLRVPCLGGGTNDGGATDHRERRTQAVSWTVAMIGGSMSSGNAFSSKYNSRASRRFAKASSIVWPWLVTSTSRARATYYSPSCMVAAVSLTVTTLGPGSSRRGNVPRAKSLVIGSAPRPCAPGRSRTRNLMGRNHLLYPVELQGHGVEGPAVRTSVGLCHTRGSLVAVAQLAERRDVAPEVAGSSPVGHPLAPGTPGLRTSRRRS